MPSLHLRSSRNVQVHSVESSFGSHPVAKLGAGPRSLEANFSNMSYWIVTTDQSLPALTAHGLSVMRSLVVPTRSTRSSSPLGDDDCARASGATRTAAVIAASSTPAARVPDFVACDLIAFLSVVPVRTSSAPTLEQPPSCRQDNGVVRSPSRRHDVDHGCVHHTVGHQ